MFAYLHENFMVIFSARRFPNITKSSDWIQAYVYLSSNYLVLFLVFFFNIYSYTHIHTFICRLGLQDKRLNPIGPVSLWVPNQLADNMIGFSTINTIMLRNLLHICSPSKKYIDRNKIATSWIYISVNSILTIQLMYLDYSKWSYRSICAQVLK